MIRSLLIRPERGDFFKVRPDLLVLLPYGLENRLEEAAVFA
jgi:hypothetical protein